MVPIKIIQIQITKEFLDRIQGELQTEGKLTPEVMVGLNALLGRQINVDLPKCKIQGEGLMIPPGQDGWHNMTRAEQIAGVYVDSDGNWLKSPPEK